MKTERTGEFYLAFRDGIPGGIYISEAIKTERKALEQLEAIAGLRESYQEIFRRHPDFFGSEEPRFAALSVSPDFHKGTGVPIGTSLLTENVCIPALMGSDIGCGMQFVFTDIPAARFDTVKPRLAEELRSVFFEGRRSLPLYAEETQRIFARGLRTPFGSLRQHTGSLWELLGDTSAAGWHDAEFAEAVFGPLACQEGITRSAHFGSIGGGNHFVEIQRIDQVYGPAPFRKNHLAVMIHSGSLSMGKAAGMVIADTLKEIYPPDMPKPPGSMYPLPLANASPHRNGAVMIMNLVRNVLNFAAANRVILGLMVRSAFRNCGLDGSFTIYHDASHNAMLPWADAADSRIIHRKGSTPAGMLQPVIIPGSMGTPSYVLTGYGNEQALCSAAHGAGRALARRTAMRSGSGALAAFLEKNTVVTPVDFEQLRRSGRQDILGEKLRDLSQEAPEAYKDINETVRITEGAGIAGRTAGMSPLLTVKQL